MTSKETENWELAWCQLCHHWWYCRFSSWQPAHDDVIKWKDFPRYWPFVRWIHQWIPLTKASDVELWWFLWSASEQTVEQTIKMQVIWDTIMLIMMSVSPMMTKLALWWWLTVFSGQSPRDPHCIPRIMHKQFMLCCVLLWFDNGRFYPHPLRLLHWYSDNHTILRRGGGYGDYRRSLAAPVDVFATFTAADGDHVWSAWSPPSPSVPSLNTVFCVICHHVGLVQFILSCVWIPWSWDS